VKLSATVDSVAGQFAGRVKVGKVDVSENFELAGEYNVSSVPRLLIFDKNRKPLHEIRGLVSEAEISNLLNKVLGKCHSPYQRRGTGGQSRLPVPRLFSCLAPQPKAGEPAG
jgi:thioredoxin-like negative regulator of GroEL